VTATNRPVLELNKLWQPIGVVNAISAISKVFVDRALVIDTETYQLYSFDEWIARKNQSKFRLRTPSIEIDVPEVIRLNYYAEYPKNREVLFTRRNLYIRDNYQCQYCGCRPGTKELSIDHVVPISRGGKSSWTNCVLACTNCNFLKADQTLAEARLKLRRQPKKPVWNVKYAIRRRHIPVSWQSFIDEAYWDIELE